MLKSTILALTALAAASVIATAPPADARERRVQGQVLTKHGEFRGQSRVERRRGERSREATVTGPNGRETSVEDNRVWNRQDGTYSRDHERTFPNGDTRSVNTEAERTAPGQWNAERTVTGRDGETRTQTGEFQAENTDNGRQVTGEIQTQNHGQIDYSREVSHEDGARNVSSSATFEDGTSVSRTSTASCASGEGCTRDTELTNRAGATTNVSETRKRSGTGSVYTRNAQFPDGTSRTVERDRDGDGEGAGTVDRTVTGRDGETRTQSGSYEVTHTP